MFDELLQLSLYLLQHLLTLMIPLINILNNHDIFLAAILLKAIKLIQDLASHLRDLGHLAQLLFVGASSRRSVLLSKRRQLTYGQVEALLVRCDAS